MTMKRLIKLGTMCCMSILLFSACDRPDDINPVGPNICPSTDFKVNTEFKINGGSSASLNFLSSPAVFTAEFSESTSWTIVITGETSGVTKTIRGEGASINESWCGEPGTDYFQVENITAVLSVSCYNEVGSVTGSITNKTNFSKFTKGFVIETFDGQSEGSGVYGPYGTAKLDEPNTGVKSSLTASPQGGSYYSLVGDASAPTWYFGGASTGINLSSLPTTDPSEIYCNFYANANGASNANAQLTFKENGVNKNYLVDVTGTDWQFFSFKLSDIGVEDPTKIGTFDWQLGSSPEQASNTEINFDFFVITTGGPLFD